MNTDRPAGYRYRTTHERFLPVYRYITSTCRVSSDRRQNVVCSQHCQFRQFHARKLRTEITYLVPQVPPAVKYSKEISGKFATSHKTTTANSQYVASSSYSDNIRYWARVVSDFLLPINRYCQKVTQSTLYQSVISSKVNKN